MKNKSIYKSEEGKKKIQTFYNKFIEILELPHNEIYIDTSFGKTFLLESGNKNGDIIFLIHGSSSNSAMWFEDLKVLSDQYHLFTIDILGEPGKSAENRLNKSNEDYAKWIREILDSLNIKKVTLIGNSFGGWIALKFATTYPEKINKLVLVATSGITPVKFSFIFKSIIYIMQGEKGLKKINKLVYGTDKIPEEVMEVSNLIFKNYNPMLGSLPTFKDSQLIKLKMPVMYIAGENDSTVNVYKSAERIKNLIPNSNIKIIKNNGHVVFNIMDEIIPFLKN